MESSENTNEHKQKFLKEAGFFLLDIVVNIIVIVLLVFVIRTYIIAPFRVYGPSMCNTLNYVETSDGNYSCLHGNGEYIIVNKFIYQDLFGWEIGNPKRGDIVVFRPPNGSGDYFIKRIIGLPGERVEIKREGSTGVVYIYNEENIDGFKLEEPYLSEENYDHTFVPSGTDNVFQVTEDNYFVLGDNRRESSDSRHCFSNLKCGEGRTSLLPEENIQGKAWVVLWPFEYMRILN